MRPFEEGIVCVTASDRVAVVARVNVSSNDPGTGASARGRHVHAVD